MISLEDCIAFSGLSEDEVAAIGEHEHIPTIAAAALADYLLKQPQGGEKIRAMIIDGYSRSALQGTDQTRARTIYGSAPFPRQTSRGEGWYGHLKLRIHVNAGLSAYLSDHRVCGESPTEIRQKNSSNTNLVRKDCKRAPAKPNGHAR